MHIREGLYLQSAATKYGSKGDGFLFFSTGTQESSGLVVDYVDLPMNFARSLGFAAHIHPEVDINFTGTLRPGQLEIAEETVKALRSVGSTILKLPPGSGKTVLGAQAVSELKRKTVILVNRKHLIKQWLKVFVTMTTGSVALISANSKGLTKEILLKVPDANITTDLQEAQIVISMLGQWGKVPDSIHHSIGFMVLDEADMLCSPKMAPLLLLDHPQYILAESATPERQDDLHNVLYALCGSECVSRPIEKEFQVYKVNTGVPAERVPNAVGTTDWSHLIKSVLFNEKRDQLILEIVKSNPQYKILILSSMVEHVKLLHGKIELEEKCDYLAGSKGEHFNSRVLIGTFGKVGVGYDESNCCADYDGEPINMLILVTSVKNEKKLEQFIGRVFRSELPVIIQLVDDDSILKSHWSKFKKWYQSVGGVVHD